MVAVIEEAWIGGVSARRVDEILPQAMGLSGISSEEPGLETLCKEIDERVKAFLERPLEGDWPYLWLDATYQKSARGRTHRLGARRDNRCGRQHRRTARDRRARPGPVRQPRPSGRTS